MPVITKTNVSSNSLLIYGQNFGTKMGTVRLGDTLLTVQTWSQQEIDAVLPSPTDPGSYLLVVTLPTRPIPLIAALGVTLGGQGLQGPQGPQGPDGPQGKAGLIDPSKLHTVTCTAKYSCACPSSPSSETLISGGAQCPSSESDNHLLASSYPSANTWFASCGGYDSNGAFGTGFPSKIYIICLSP